MDEKWNYPFSQSHFIVKFCAVHWQCFQETDQQFIVKPLSHNEFIANVCKCCAGEQENLFIEVMLKYQICLTHRSGESPGTQSNES